MRARATDELAVYCEKGASSYSTPSTSQTDYFQVLLVMAQDDGKGERAPMKKDWLAELETKVI